MFSAATRLLLVSEDRIAILSLSGIPVITKLQSGLASADGHGGLVALFLTCIEAIEFVVGRTAFLS